MVPREIGTRLSFRDGRGLVCIPGGCVLREAYGSFLIVVPRLKRSPIFTAQNGTSSCVLASTHGRLLALHTHRCENVIVCLDLP